MTRKVVIAFTISLFIHNALLSAILAETEIKAGPGDTLTVRSGSLRADVKVKNGLELELIVAISISASAVVAGITFGVRHALKINRHKGWQEKAKKEEPPKKCQHCTRYCRKIEIEVEPALRRVAQLSYVVHDPTSGKKQQKVQLNGKIVSELKKAVNSHRRRKKSEKLERLVADVSYIILQQIEKWLHTEPVSRNISFTGHLEGGKVTSEFILYHCKRKGSVNVWEEEDKWKVTIKDKRDLHICTLRGLDPAEAGMLERVVPELTRRLTEFIKKV
ncbi:MAG: hypothetical protein ACYSTI_10400 [Planctomycetota bacterium]|jgi:hypothetical protein